MPSADEAAGGQPASGVTLPDFPLHTVSPADGFWAFRRVLFVEQAFYCSGAAAGCFSGGNLLADDGGSRLSCGAFAAVLSARQPTQPARTKAGRGARSKSRPGSASKVSPKEAKPTTAGLVLAAALSPPSCPRDSQRSQREPRQEGTHEVSPARAAPQKLAQRRRSRRRRVSSWLRRSRRRLARATANATGANQGRKGRTK